MPVWAVFAVGVAAGAAAMGTYSLVRPNRTTGPTITLPEGSGVSLGTSQLTPIEGETSPRPYAYDPITNRYWDPTHRHWHNGPPPNRDSVRADPVSRASTLPASPAVATSSEPPPAPWTYDPKTNRHWHPLHRHWHNGPPPADSVRAVDRRDSGIATTDTGGPAGTPAATDTKADSITALTPASADTSAVPDAPGP